MSTVPSKLLKVLQWVALSASGKMSLPDQFKKIHIGKGSISSTDGALLMRIERVKSAVCKDFDEDINDDRIAMLSPAELGTCEYDIEYVELWCDAEGEGKDFAEVISTQEGSKITFDPHYLKQICEAAIATQGFISFDIIDAETMVKFCSTGDRGDFAVTGVIMPVRLRKKDAWDWVKRLKPKVTA
jgi:hypothetical protein